MCLELSPKHREKTEEFRNSSKVLYGYKILQVKEDSKYISPFQDFEFEVGKEYISTRDSTDLDEVEKIKLEVSHGFHFYTEIEEDYFCKEENKICPYLHLHPHLHRCLGQYIWIKFEIKPKDLVAVGEFDSYNSFVAHKCKLVEIFQ